MYTQAVNYNSKREKKITSYIAPGFDFSVSVTEGLCVFFLSSWSMFRGRARQTPMGLLLNSILPRHLMHQKSMP